MGIPRPVIINESISTRRYCIVLKCRSTKQECRSTEQECRSTNQEYRSTKHNVPTHVTKVSYHLIPGLRHSYDYMYSETSYPFIGHEVCPYQTRFIEAVRYGTFFTSFLPYLYSRYANYSLTMQKDQNPGLQELVVPVPLCSVPVLNQFWRVVLVPLWVVPVLFCFCISGTGTTPVWYRYQVVFLPRNGRIHSYSLTSLP